MCVNTRRMHRPLCVRRRIQSSVLERIKQHTGIDVSVLSNSEQRFMNYKAYAAKSKFEDADTKNRALLDIGAGSLQISIFDKQNLIQTQNLPIGAVRIRDYLAKYGADTVALENIMEEFVSNFIEEFRNLFINDKDIKSIIAIGDGIANLKKVRTGAEYHRQDHKRSVPRALSQGS